MIDWKQSPAEYFKDLNKELDFIKVVEIYHWKNHFLTGAVKIELLPFCPYCKSKKVCKLRIQVTPRRFQCNDCRKQFNVFTKTPFYRSKADLLLWFHIYWYKKNGKTVKEISKLFKKRTRDIENVLEKLEVEDREIAGHYIGQIMTNYLHYKYAWGSQKRDYTKLPY